MNVPLIDFNGRVRDRVRELRSRRIRLAAKVLLGLMVVAGLAWVGVASPLFSVKKVVVSGNAIVSTDDVTKAATVPMGVPLAQVDAAAISRRIVTLPAVARGDVALSLPDTVTIKIIERAVAFVVADGGGFAWVDATGATFNSSTERPAGVPLAVADLNDHQLLSDVATVVSALPSRLTDKVVQVTAPTRDSIVIATGERTQIVWGSAESSSLKGQLADTMTKVQPTCRSVDVSSPSHPTTRC